MGKNLLFVNKKLLIGIKLFKINVLYYKYELIV